jgi:hypothetical protein
MAMTAAAGSSKLSAVAPFVPVSGSNTSAAVLLVVTLSAVMSATAVTMHLPACCWRSRRQRHECV